MDSLTGALSLLEIRIPMLNKVSGTPNDYLYRVFATFALYHLNRALLIHTTVFSGDVGWQLLWNGSSGSLASAVIKGNI